MFIGERTYNFLVLFIFPILEVRLYHLIECLEQFLLPLFSDPSAWELKLWYPERGMDLTKITERRESLWHFLPWKKSLLEMSPTWAPLSGRSAPATAWLSILCVTDQVEHWGLRFKCLLCHKTLPLRPCALVSSSLKWEHGIRQPWACSISDSWGLFQSQTPSWGFRPSFRAQIESGEKGSTWWEHHLHRQPGSCLWFQAWPWLQPCVVLHIRENGLWVMCLLRPWAGEWRKLGEAGGRRTDCLTTD